MSISGQLKSKKEIIDDIINYIPEIDITLNIKENIKKIVN